MVVDAQTIGDVVRRFRSGGDAKSTGASPTGWRERRPVNPAVIDHIGKEVDDPETDAAGIRLDRSSVLRYGPNAVLAYDNIRTALSTVPTQRLAYETGISERQLKRLLRTTNATIRHRRYVQLAEAACRRRGIPTSRSGLPDGWEQLVAIALTAVPLGVCHSCQAPIRRRGKRYCDERCRSRHRRGRGQAC